MAYSLSLHTYINFFFFNDTATTEIYTLSLHDALPISPTRPTCFRRGPSARSRPISSSDRKSTRLNSSHEWISYAVFCLKKKKQTVESPISSAHSKSSPTSSSSRTAPCSSRAGRHVSSARLLSRRASFFFNDTATTEIYTLSLHDALPI